MKLAFEDSACLEAGANDFGGTLMEESISKAAGANFGAYVAPGEFRALIRTNGVLIKPKRVVDPRDVLTPAEAKKVRHAMKQLRQGKGRPWSQIKHELGL